MEIRKIENAATCGSEKYIIKIQIGESFTDRKHNRVDGPATILVNVPDWAAMSGKGINYGVIWADKPGITGGITTLDGSRWLSKRAFNWARTWACHTFDTYVVGSTNNSFPAVLHASGGIDASELIFEDEVAMPLFTHNGSYYLILKSGVHYPGITK